MAVTISGPGYFSSTVYGGALSVTGRAALEATERGFFVLPICWPDPRGGCACWKQHSGKEIGKAPLLGSRYQDTRMTPENVVRYWARFPQANWGILLEPSALFVLDADSLEADREIEERGCPPGPRVRRGEHIHRYFRGIGIIGRALHTGASGKLDILSAGYILGPGSLHRCGDRYVLEVSFDDVALEDPPTWAVARLRDAQRGRRQGDTARIVVGDLVIDPLADPPAAKFDVLCHNNPQFKASWEHKRPDLADTSASGFDLSLAGHASAAGWSNQELVDLIVAHRRKWGEAQHLNLSYFRATIGKAQARAQAMEQSRQDRAQAQGGPLEQKRLQHRAARKAAAELAQRRREAAIALSHALANK